MPKLEITSNKGLIQKAGTTDIVLKNDHLAGQKRTVEALSSAKTLTAADSGKVFTLDSDGGAFAITLPTATSAAEGAALMGFTVTVVDYDISGNNVTIVRGDTSNDAITGGACSIADGAAAGITVGSNVITFVGGTSVVGDRVEVISDGTTWQCITHSGANGGITSSG